MNLNRITKTVGWILIGGLIWFAVETTIAEYRSKALTEQDADSEPVMIYRNDMQRLNLYPLPTSTEYEAI